MESAPSSDEAAGLIATENGALVNLGALDAGAAVRPYPGERTSGDATVIDERDATLFAAIVDVLGHGPKAHEVAQLAESFLRENWTPDVAATLLGLHRALASTRGAVAGLMAVDRDTALLEYAGVGNTEFHVLGARARRLHSVEGIVGSRIRTPRPERLTLARGDTIVLHTDGVSAGLESVLAGTPEPAGAQAGATRIVAQLGKAHDDAACIVMAVG